MVAMPLAAQTFVSAYRVRLKEHRKTYKALFIIVFIFLIFNTLVVLFNKELYLVLDNPKKHFAYNMHIASQLAKKLKKEKIFCLKTDESMQQRLRFYGIGTCDDIHLHELSIKNTQEADVTISYKNKILYKANVTKLNSK
jgi:hypothetical protein